MAGPCLSGQIAGIYLIPTKYQLPSPLSSQCRLISNEAGLNACNESMSGFVN